MATVSESNQEHPSQSRTREIVSDSLAVGVVVALSLTVVQRIIGFLRGILFCRFMTDQQLGQWSMIWSFMMLLAPLAVLGLPGSFGRFVEHYRQQGQMRTFIRRIGFVSLVMTLMMSAAILSFPETFSWWIFRETSQTGIVIALGVTILFVALSNFLMSLMESLRQVRLVTFMRFILGIVFAVTGTGLLLFSQQASVAVTYAYAISCAAAAIPAIWFLSKNRAKMVDHGERLTHGTLWKRIAPFAIWLWFTNIFSNLFEVADRYMLIHWSPVESSIAQGMVGQYHSGRVVPLLLVGVAAILAGILLPYMSEAWEKGKRAQTRIQQNWTIKLVAIGFTAGAFILQLGTPFLFDQVLQGRYDEGLAILPLTMVYCIWLSLLTVGQDYLWVAEKGRFALCAIAIGLTVNLVANGLMIPVWGVWGAVIATSIANLVAVSVCMMFNHLLGCHTDRGIWIALFVPLLLLLPPLSGALILTAVLLAAFKTGWLFTSREAKQFSAAHQKIRDKIQALSQKRS